ncbi:hypothetical protein L0663_05305 [Dyadobacter sp. CY107]|uniref:hypothetical protein n=1 Tax=Dyadobacter fanqingshengii TaxID=2906443 RepID=UPI001F291E8D|nr:hypothetical protein [Dyadobacter fanqingshengii]MCF2502784.1 hypothetical protein [Dyadobacter fanqingshengii]
MIIRGASRSNGKQLPQYLQIPAENERVEYFGGWGTSDPNDLTASIVEMDRLAG